MNRPKTFLKNLFFPVTLLTVITALSIISSAWALSFIFFGGHSAAMLAAITVQITILLIILYIFDRILVKRVPHYRVTLGEIALGIFLFFCYSFQDSTIDINFHSKKNFVVVIFDSKENPISDFTRSGIFGKELNIYNNNIVHVDSALYIKKELRINVPQQWVGFNREEGSFDIRGRSIKYVFCSNNNSSVHSNKNLFQYNDSLLSKVKNRLSSIR